MRREVNMLVPLNFYFIDGVLLISSSLFKLPFRIQVHLFLGNVISYYFCSSTFLRDDGFAGSLHLP
jgi:hypothetical protein